MTLEYGERVPFISKAGLIDLVERASTAFVHTAISVWLGGNATGLANISLLESSALAGVAAALTTIQGFLGTRLNGGTSARIIPKPQPQPPRQFNDTDTSPLVQDRSPLI